MRAGGDANVTAANLGDRFARGYECAYGHERWSGMAVVDVPALIRAAVDFEHRRVGAEAVDALLPSCTIVPEAIATSVTCEPQSALTVGISTPWQSGNYVRAHRPTQICASGSATLGGVALSIM